MFGASSAAEGGELRTTLDQKLGLVKRDESSLNLVAQSPAKAYRFGMKVIIHLSEEEELKALPLLLRHSPGMVLPNRTYILSEEALKALRSNGIRYSEVSREAVAPSLEEAAGERV